MSVSFGGIGEEMVTFTAAAGLSAGNTAAMTANGKVGKAASGGKFCGVAVKVSDDGHATVQMKGYVNLAYTGATAPQVGYGSLAGDGSGGVKVDAENGREYLVIDVDTTNKKVGFYL